MGNDVDKPTGKKVAAPREKQTTLEPTKLKARITILGPAQTIRVTYPDAEGGRITTAFAKLYARASGPPNDAARKVGLGDHGFGKLTLPLFEEPAYTDFGRNASSGGGTALVIGNEKYDSSKKMGSSAIQNRDIDGARKDADKVEGVLKSKGFSAKKLYDKTGGEIVKAIADSSQNIQTGACFFIYFCGHGTFDGLIGTDGAAAAPSLLADLIPQCLKAQCDLVIALDACHQGIVVDVGRIKLFDFAKDRDAAKPKMLSFIDAAKSLAAEKDKFNQAILTILQEQWRIEAVPKMDTDTWLKNYDKRSDAWNQFVVSGQTLVDQAIKSRNAVKAGLKKLTLAKCKPRVEQEEEKKIWAQLDSIDIILNEAVSGQFTAT